MPMTGYVLRGAYWVPLVGESAGNPSIPAAGNPRDSLVYGTYKPGASTTGVMGSSFVSTPGTTYSVSDQTITGREFTGQVVVNANNLVFRDCIFRGNGTDKLVRASAGNDYKNARFIDCSFDATGSEGVFVDGISGANFTLERCEMTRVVDAIGLISNLGNVQILGCWIHNSAVFTWAPGTPGMPGFSDNRTHNDGVQFHAGSGYVIRGNYIGGLRKNYSKSDPAQDPSIPDSADDFDNTCILVQQEIDSTAGNKLRNILIENNWFEGGAASLNIGYKFSNDLSDNVVIQNNRWLRRISPGGGFYIYKHTSANPTLTGNVFDDDGTPVTVNTYSG